MSDGTQDGAAIQSRQDVPQGFGQLTGHGPALGTDNARGCAIQQGGTSSELQRRQPLPTGSSSEAPADKCNGAKGTRPLWGDVVESYRKRLAMDKGREGRQKSTPKKASPLDPKHEVVYL